MENSRRLYEKANKEIERFGYYLNNDIPIEEVQKIRSYILNNKQLMKLYGEKSAEELMVSYLKEIEHIIVDLAAKHDYQYLANILEYFRFMCMRENIESAIPGIEFFENLSDSKFSSILLGKASADIPIVMEDEEVTISSKLGMGNLEEEYAELGGWEAESDASQLLQGLIFGQPFLDMSKKTGQLGLRQNLSPPRCTVRHIPPAALSSPQCQAYAAH